MILKTYLIIKNIMGMNGMKYITKDLNIMKNVKRKKWI